MAVLELANISKHFGAIQAVAPSLGMEFSAIGVRDPAEIERGVAVSARSSVNGGLIVTASVGVASTRSACRWSLVSSRGTLSITHKVPSA